MKTKINKKFLLTLTLLSLLSLSLVLIFVLPRKLAKTVDSGRETCSPDRLYFDNSPLTLSLAKQPLEEWSQTLSEEGTKVTFSQGAYSLSLLPAGLNQADPDFFWGHTGGCFFPDTPGYQNRQTYGETVGAFEIPKYTELTLLDGSLLRRGQAVYSTQPKVKASEIVCYKSALPSAKYFENSSLGYMTIDYPPNNPTPQLLGEIDQILSSLQIDYTSSCTD